MDMGRRKNVNLSEDSANADERNRFQHLFDTMPLGAVYQDASGKVIDANLAAQKILGLTLDQMQGRTSADPRWKAIHEDGSDFPGETHPAMLSLKTGQPIHNVVMGVFNPSLNAYRWINVNAIPRFTPGADTPYEVYTTFEDITERKRTEETLKMFDERFRRTFDDMLEGCMLIGFDWRYLYLNEAAAQHGHQRREDLLGRSILEVYPGVEDSDVFAHYRKCMEERLSQHFISSFTFADGTTNYYEFRAQPAIEGIFVFSTDITEQKRISAALAEADARLHMVLNNVPITIFALDRDGKFTLSEGKSLERVGLKPGEHVGDSAIELYASIPYMEFNGNKTTGKDVIERVLAGESINAVNEFNGVIFENHFRPMQNSAGDAIGLVGIAIDITERRQAEDQNAKLTERLELATRSAQIGIWDWDVQRNQLIWDDRMCALYGIQPGDFSGAYQSWLQRLHPDDRAASEEFARQALSGNREYNTEFRVVWPGGSIHWLKAYGLIFRDEDGRPIRQVGVNYDITNQKQADEKIKRQIEYLSALREIDRAIEASFDINTSLNMLLLRTTALLNVDAAAVLLVKPDLGSLEFMAGIGFRTSAITIADTRLGAGLAGIVALKREQIQIPNLDQVPDDLLLSSSLREEAFVYFCGVPLIVKGKVIGVLEVFHRKATERDQEWLDFLNTLAGQAAIAIDNAQMFDGLQKSNFELMTAYDDTIVGWSRAMDLRDEETEGHTQRVTELTEKLAEKMRYPSREIVHVRRGALLHDIGKLGVPDSILLKPHTLSVEEWEVMRRHPVYARDMLLPIAYLRPALDIPYCHHEKWDGTGYPQGLKSDQIPWAARIFSVVDVWDAVTSNRPYRSAWSKEQALAYLKEQSGRQFDPDVVNAFLEMIGKENGTKKL